MSICLTCFLSCFQCVTLKSTNATCMHVKVWMQGHVTGIVVILFMMNAVMCISPLIYTVSGTNVTNMEYAFRFSYCIVIFPGNTSFVSNSFILFARDLVFVTGMSIASCSILHTLYRHGKQVKGIRNSEKSQSLSAEARASKTVSTLVSLYVLFFGIDNSVWFYQSTSPKTILTSTSDIRFFFSVSYSSVFPFVILFFNQKILQTLRRVSSEPQHSREDISVVTTVQ
ncbi:olfactory receptor class A-like protein 1 [Pleurodeles waltl]|uniref:olfactory receptor class A-like protein 1 n=1 Tax=Pleurodeles waltl TaxID=8319 RepID=UPI003709BA50